MARERQLPTLTLSNGRPCAKHFGDKPQRRNRSPFVLPLPASLVVRARLGPSEDGGDGWLSGGGHHEDDDDDDVL